MRGPAILLSERKMRVWKRWRSKIANNFRFRRCVRREARVLLARQGPSAALEEIRLVRCASQDPVIKALAYNIEREIRESAFQVEEFELNRFTLPYVQAQISTAAGRTRLPADRPLDIESLQTRFRQAQLAPHSPLTDRQMECLEWAAHGKSSADIAVILGLSKRTVDEHLAATCDKLGVKTRVQAVGKLEKIRGLASTP